MKVSSALTMTTVLSILSATHGAPILSAQDTTSTAPAHGHYRRASSVSELAGRDYAGNDLLEGLNYAYEPGSHIKTLLNFVKRQLGGGGSSTGLASDNQSSDSSSDSSSDGSSGGSSSGTEQTGTTETANNGGAGLMGGGLTSPQNAGFAHEPGQGIKAT